MRTGSLPVINVDLVAYPPQPDGVPWPTGEWPTGESENCRTRKLNKLLDVAMGSEVSSELGLTRAIVVVQAGRIVAERYGSGVANPFEPDKEVRPDGPDTPMLSWSMAKSMLQVAIGVAMVDHDIALDSRIAVPEWDDPDDPRHAITWHHLLHMASGLSWIEEYTTDRGSDVIGMLYGDGKADMAAYAASFPLAARPGTQFLYSSGTTNILARALQRTIGLEGDADGMQRWLRDRLFDPLAMSSVVCDFDDAGTWIASSYVHATARDYARFGLMALRGGVFAGRRLVSESWIDAARRPIKLPTGHAHRYGSHWWVHDDTHGTFAAHGFEEQRIICVPDKDLVVVRLGKTPTAVNSRDRDPTPVDIYLDKLIATFND